MTHASNQPPDGRSNGSRPDAAARLGTQPVGRLLWHTCSQTTASVGIYGIYALTNAWFVSHGVGETALAAVNLVAPMLLLVGAVSTTVGVGGASLVSRALGAGDTPGAARAAGNAFVVFWAVAALLTVVGLALLGPILTLLGARGDTLVLARPYAAIIVAGSLVSTGFSAIVRAEGRLRFSTLLWVIPVLVQITLDPLLIFGLHLGVAGAALGTVGGQAVSAGMSVWFFFVQRRRPYRIALADLRPRAATVGRLLSIGAPSFLAGFGATLLAALINTRLAPVGAVALAAFAVANRIQTFVAMPQTGITQGVQPIVGYNAGAGHASRVARARNLALAATVLYGALAAGAIVAAAPWLVRFFVSDPAVIATAVPALRIIATGFVVAGIAPLISAYFQSLGRAAPSYAISIGTLLALKVPLVVVLGRLGLAGLWVALPAGEALGAAAALVILWRATRAGVTRER